MSADVMTRVCIGVSFRNLGVRVPVTTISSKSYWRKMESVWLSTTTALCCICAVVSRGKQPDIKSRDSKYGGGNDEREQTLNQLLAEMDGFDSSKGIFILAATNRPEVLDKALLRPGRLDRRITVDRPDKKGRIETLKVHSKDVLMDDTVDFDEIAMATSGLVGSDLANIINEAAIAAVKNGRNVVTQKDLLGAFDTVVAGKEKKERVLSKKEKQVVAP